MEHGIVNTNDRISLLARKFRHQPSRWLWASSALLLSAAAVAGDGVTVNITNDGTEDIVVTVYDMSLGPRAAILSHTRINGFTTVPITVSADANGLANVAWTAVSADRSDRKCGHADQMGLADSASVAVHADSSCSAAPPAATAARFEEALD